MQGLKTKFEDAGFKPQVKPLADFQEAYGLEGDEGDSNEDEDEDGESDESEEE